MQKKNVLPVPKLICSNFDVENAPRSGTPVEADKDMINRPSTNDTGEIAERLNFSHSKVYRHLKDLRLTSKLGIWVFMFSRK